MRSRAGEGMEHSPDRAPLVDIFACLGFFTRLPIPAYGADRPFAASVWAAPIAGAVVGVVVGLTIAVSLWLGLTAPIAAAFALAVGIAVTGALHEDGAADVADGFGGGATRDDKLAIMRDSRIGTYGVVVLVLSLLTRWAALATIAEALGSKALLAAIAAHAASRALLPAFAGLLPPARTDGLSSTLGTVGPKVYVVALALGFLALLPLGVAYTLVALVALAVLFFCFHQLSRRQIGGQTGDVLGALQQAAEVLLLTIAATTMT